MENTGRKLANNAGMTLLELTFASGILAVSLSLLFGSLININLIGEVSRDKTAASATLASIMEDIRRQSFTDLLTYTPPELSYPGKDHTVLLECYDSQDQSIELPLVAAEGEVSVDINDLNLPNPVEVKATLVWTDGRGRAYTMHATTLCER